MNPAGPHLAVAVLCEKVLEEKDGTLSLIRIVDRIMQSVRGYGTPTEMQPFDVGPLVMVVSLKSDRARGRFEVRLRMERPSGLQEDLPIALPVLMEGDERGQNLLLNFGFRADLEGLYWFDVLLNQEAITRIPLRVLYQRLDLGPLPPNAG